MKTFTNRLPIGFWTIYTLGFTVVLPTFLYYNADDLPGPGPVPDQSATTSFLYLGIGLALWLAVIIWYMRFYLRLVIFDKKSLLRAIESGRPIHAKILSKKVLHVRRSHTVLELQLSFTNLSGTAVEVDYELNDARAAENRFEPGNDMMLQAYKDGQQAYLLPATAEISINPAMVIIYALIFLLILFFAVGYIMLSYQWESQGYGWRFLKLWHPWILVPAINLALIGIKGLFLGFIDKSSGSATPPLRWILYGLKTTATITSLKQTGLSINDQPQVAFELEYTDQHGTVHKIVHKEIINLLELHRLSAGAKEILYLPDQPQEITFYESLS